MRLGQGAGLLALREPVMWARHKYCGWVCMHCGHHARQWMSRQVHERRALRGLGCNDDGMKPNALVSECPEGIRST